MSKKILVVVPHGDDDCLSFSGLIQSEIENGSEVRLVYLTIGGCHKLQNYHNRLQEAKDAADYIGIPWDNVSILYDNMDAMMDTVPLRETASKLDKIVDEYKPDLLLTTLPSNHQDHIHLYQAVRIHLRMRDGFVVPNVLFGEYQFLMSEVSIPFNGKIYHSMTDLELQRKQMHFSCFKSQVRPFPSPLGIEGIRILAESRGLECGERYAECYYVYRMKI